MVSTSAGLGEFLTYDADNRRPGLTICSGAVTNSYYSADWQVLEDDIVNGSTTTKDTYVWSLSYIDDMVARDQSVNGGAATRIYAQQDANHDFTALVNASGSVVERFDYDPYGTATVLNASWGGTTDAYSWVYRFQGGRYDPSSGKINFRNRDLDTVTGTWMEKDPAGYGPVGGESTYSGEPFHSAAVYRFDGTQYAGVSGTPNLAAVMYNPTMGIWIAPGPVEHGNGMNLYQAYSDNPVDLEDPMGLFVGLGAGHQRAPGIGSPCCLKYDTGWHISGYTSMSACWKAEYAKYSLWNKIPAPWNTITASALGAGSKIAGAVGGKVGKAGSAVGWALYGAAVYQVGLTAGAALSCGDSYCTKGGHVTSTCPYKCG